MAFASSSIALQNVPGNVGYLSSHNSTQQISHQLRTPYCSSSSKCSSAMTRFTPIIISSRTLLVCVDREEGIFLPAAMLCMKRWQSVVEVIIKSARGRADVYASFYDPIWRLFTTDGYPIVDWQPTFDKHCLAACVAHVLNFLPQQRLLAWSLYGWPV